VANSYHPLEYKSFRGAWRVQYLQRHPEDLQKVITTVDLDVIGADPERCGLKGSPTIVAHTDKVGEIGGSCKVFEGHAPDEMVRDVIKAVDVKELLAV
jgi:electron transfer flavoprotein beta subunit